MDDNKPDTKHENGDKILCPYCAKPGTVIRVFADGSVDICHKFGKRKTVAAATGKTIEVNSFIDGCSRHGKLGSIAWVEPEEGFEL